MTSPVSSALKTSTLSALRTSVTFVLRLEGRRGHRELVQRFHYPVSLFERDAWSLRNAGINRFRPRSLPPAQ